MIRVLQYFCPPVYFGWLRNVNTVSNSDMKVQIEDRSFTNQNSMVVRQTIWKDINSNFESNFELHLSKKEDIIGS